MAPITLMPHEDIKGKFCTIARLKAVEGKADEMASLLGPLCRYSNDKTKELDTLTYRVLRGAGPQSDIFTVVEEYANREALTHHRSSEPYQAFRNSGTIGTTEVVFHEEFGL